MSDWETSALYGKQIPVFCTSLLVLLAIVSAARGFVLLIGSSGKPVDLRSRSEEVTGLLNGSAAENYRDRKRLHEDLSRVPENSLQAASIAEQLLEVRKRGRIPTSGGYPPTSFLSLILLCWPAWPGVRVYFAAWQLLSIAAIIWSLFFLSKDLSRLNRTLLAASVLSVNAIGNTLIIGQLGIVCTAALFVTLICLERGQDLRAASLLAFALVKPIISGPFLFILVTTRHWRALALMCSLIVLSSGIYVQLMNSGTDLIWRTIEHLEKASIRASERGFSGVSVLVDFGMSREVALVTAASAGAALLGLTIFILKDTPLLLQFSLLGFIARYATSHDTYDNVLMIYLLVSLFLAAHRSGGNRLLTVSFWATAVMLWLPRRAYQIGSLLTGFQTLIWTASLAILIREVLANPELLRIPGNSNDPDSLPEKI